MPRKSKSRITTRSHSKVKDVSLSYTTKRRLPRHRPPTHPGDMIREEFLVPLEMTQTELASRLGVSFPRLNEVIRGKRGVTPDTALRLERVLGMPAEFWLGLQQDWDLWHAMRGTKAAEIARLEPLK
ncbi:HigA family addiction module antitoxin [Candidatus Eisenbacteria bacterium]|uniref:HigA family addiction module antitoxin n=1 Tax=Eiseniibacteriota bacterium TaxID=2212470 RepID=A0ABV6YMK6_UNCEI